MKLGKQPKRFGRPSLAFAERRRDPMADRSDGPIYVYLDDERPCPDGWRLARSAAAFFEIIEGPDADRITHISLDWYLGVGVRDGMAIAQKLADMIEDRPQMLPALKVIACHSSDRDMAIQMARIIEAALPADRLDSIRFRMRTPTVSLAAAC